MKQLLLVLFLLFQSASALSASLDDLPVQNNGRIKPFDTLARETSLFLTGKYKYQGNSPQEFYLALINDKTLRDSEFINVRSVETRRKLGLQKDKRFFSVKELKLSSIEAIVQPLFAKDANQLNPDEKALIEVFHQVALAESISSGEHFVQAVTFDFNPHSQNTAVTQAANQFLEKRDNETLQNLKNVVAAQKMPELFRKQIDKVDEEVFYNRAHLFLWGAFGFLILGGLCFLPIKKISTKVISSLFILSCGLLLSGFSLRVYITGFAPVTNMYGTMLWVSFGIAFFTYLLFLLYRQRKFAGSLWLGCAALLFLTEGLPLTLSPDMDPIVAVLRNNLWLTIHVLTITISYAAFTITMLIGNYFLLQNLFGTPDTKLLKTASHSVYRMVQLGVFLLSVGIILGGVWADYSWGRFWGWDPKETWALIADLGFLAILHARYLGWLKDFGILAAAPIAYLLVIMAWYGVNFILATGLHSYGFSSGGATAVMIFVIAQVTLISTSLSLHYYRQTIRK